MLILYSFAIFVNAALLFLVQPMFARMVLPLLGGSPAVWNTALVFFQAALLAGYGYAHLSSRWLGIKAQAILHCILLAGLMLLLPIAVPKGWTPPAESNPVLWLLALLAVAVGLPFFVVSAGSPLLQKWFAATGHPAAKDPYFLYAASNLGNMVALLGYPFLVEPKLTLAAQSQWWARGYGLLFLLMCGAAIVLWRSKIALAEPENTPLSTKNETSSVTSRRRLRWVMLSLVPSSLMVSVTTYISTDVAAIPLSWIVPLSLYLLSFIVAFASRPIVPPIVWSRAMPILLLPLVVTIAVRANHPLILLMPLHLLSLFVVAMACHVALAQDRPSTHYLTEFYLWISIGGVLGGAFNALLAPLIFHSVVEYPITLVLACLFGLRKGESAPEVHKKARRAVFLDFLLPAALLCVTVAIILLLRQQGMKSGPFFLALAFGFGTIWAFGFSRRPVRFGLAIGAILTAGLTFYEDDNFGHILMTERSFFGVHRVSLDPTGKFRQLVHGNTLHGSQSLEAKYSHEPLTYYTTSGPTGDVFKYYGTKLRRVGVVGLGAGSLAYYARPAQQWTFFEIDPVVVKIARDPKYFSYLQNCKAPYSIVLGDGRLKLESVPDGHFDLLMLDAYSSDSLPVHLLTREALQLYLRKVAPRGLVAFHVSNRHLTIEPVLANLVRDAGVFGLNRNDEFVAEAETKRGKVASQWIVVARAQQSLAPLAADNRWKPLLTSKQVGVWTDDYSSLLSVLKG